MNSVTVNPDSPNIIDVLAVIPSDVGGWTIREMCVKDEEGNMIAVCNTPDTEKVIITSGANGSEFLFVRHFLPLFSEWLNFQFPQMPGISAGQHPRTRGQMVN